MLQQVAELVGLDDAQVDRHAGVGARPRGVLAGRRGALDDVELGEGGQQRRRVGGGGDDVEVLDGVGQAPRRAGELDAVGGRVRAQRLDDPVADLQRLVEQHARLRRLADAGRERLEHGLLELRPEAAHVAQLLGLGGRAQALERVDAELVVELAGALGAEAGQARQVDEAGREFAAQLLDGRDRAGVEQRLDLLLERAADAGQLGDLALARHGRDRARRLAHRLGGVAVGERRGARRRRRARRGRPARRRARRWWRWADRAWALAHKVRGPS